MKLNDYNKEELELMGYDELAIIVLQEAGKKMKIADIFKKICKVLELPDNEFENQIGDFFELISTNKNFIMLENGYWDLKSKHNAKVIIDEEDTIDVVDEEEVTLEENEETDIFYENAEDDDVAEDDLNDLVIIDMDEEEAEL